MRNKRKGITPGKIALTLFGVVSAATLGYVAVMSATYKPQILPGTKFASTVDLSGLTEPEAKAKIEAWWDQKSKETLTFAPGHLLKTPEPKSLQDLGVKFDKDASLKSLPYDGFVDEIKQTIGIKRPQNSKNVDPKYKFEPDLSQYLAEFVTKNQPPVRPARATWDGENVSYEFESNGMEFDSSGLSKSISSALENNTPIEIPIKEGPKTVSDSELKKIKTIVSEFTTSYSEGKASRSSNIRLAAKLINGTILMPGEQFSFNGHLGQRTIAKGFKVAGVYVGGKHDVDVGGGICQVSTTLYNALLLGDLKADSRNPHSLPVPYVPLGRDAAVSFPNPDLKFTNPFDTPIALSASTSPGKITFRILGPAKNKREIKFESKLISTWSRGEKIVDEPGLRYGQRKVLDRGGSGRKVQTWKLIYEDGKLVERIDLGYSTYSGGPVIIGVNKSAKPPVANPGTSGTATAPSSPPASGGDDAAN